MGWSDTLQEVPQKVKRQVKHGLENEAVLDDLMEPRTPMSSNNSMRKYQQKILHISKEVGTLIDKFEMAGLDKQTGFRYRNQMREIIQDLEDTVSKLKGEVK